MIYYWFFLGVITGSFLNVCIHRLPRGESLLFPSSRCPACGAKLKPFDLIPILGYFILRGRCRYCGEKISFRYPLVEILAGLAFAWVWYWNAGNYFYLAFQLVFVCLLITVFFIDLELQVIPDYVSMAGIITGLAYNISASLFLPAENGMGLVISSVLGAGLGYAIMAAISKGGEWCFKKEAMGEGDWMLAAMLGAFFGWKGVLATIFMAFLLAAFVSVILLLLKKVKFGQQIPFGPALAAAAFIYLFWGDKIIEWYLRLGI